MEIEETDTNSNTTKYFGRTLKGWAKILLILVSLGGLAWLCYDFLSPSSKYIYLDAPGLDFRPRPNPEEDPDSTLLWYKRGNDDNARWWYSQLYYYTESIKWEKDKLQVCSYENRNQASKNKSCYAEIQEPGACTTSNKFGYLTGDPCILIRLHPEVDWKPKPFGIDARGEYDENLLEEDLREQTNKGMPDWLSEHIKGEAKKPNSLLNTVWISCAGENVADKESLGAVKYIPRPGIPGYFFPYKNQKDYQRCKVGWDLETSGKFCNPEDYLTPYMFVQLMTPKYREQINIECRLWARNINNDRSNPLGYVHFEILID